MYMYVSLTSEEEGRGLAFKIAVVVFLISSFIHSSSVSLPGWHPCEMFLCILWNNNIQERNY